MYNGKRLIACCSFVLSLAAGCTLSDPQECIYGQHKCVSDKNGNIYQYCSADGVWQYHSCNICDGNSCKDFADCGSDFVPTCKNSEDGIGFIESCVDNKVRPASPCPYSAPCKDDHSCGIGIDASEGCIDNDTLCVSIQDGHHLGTCKGNRWVMSECKEGEVCIDGKRCGVDEVIEVVDTCDSENATVCKNVTESGETFGMMHVCRDGVWRKDNACEKRVLCDGAVCSDPDPCVSPKLICGDNMCIDPETSFTYCGAKDDCYGRNAGVTCLENQECRGGVCVCTDEMRRVCKNMNGELACIDYTSNDELCGCDKDDSGVNCTAIDNIENGKCKSGVCTYESCTTGYGDCDRNVLNGCETDILNNMTGLNCGGCGDDFKCEIPNMASAACVEGKCVYECAEGFAKCGDKCVKLEDDMNHCGFCGNACDSSRETCSGGFCTLNETCKEGYNYVDVKVTLKDGTEKVVKAYCVDSYETLKFIADKYNKSSETSAEVPVGNKDNAYILTNDIVLQNDFPSIGRSGNLFKGIFLGNGKKITSAGPLKYKNDIAGIFGNAEGAIFDGFNIDYEGYVPNSPTVIRISLLVGDARNCVIRRSVVHSSLLSAHYEAGLIVGRAQSSVIKWCRSSGKIESSKGVSVSSGSDARLGGLAGYLIDSVVEDSTSSADVSIVKPDVIGAGGLVGLVENTSIYRSSASGNVTGEKDRLGGLVGYVNRADCVIEDCFATGDVVSKNASSVGSIGGLIGYTGAVTTIKNSYATGNVTGGCFSGGLVGSFIKSKAEGCYATGSVSGAQYAGGLFGSVKNGSTVDNCYALGDVSGQYEAGGLIASLNGSNVMRSYSEGSVILDVSDNEINDHKAGGLVGSADLSTVDDSYSKSKVAIPRDGDAGGFVGYARASKFNRDMSYGDVNCYGTGGGFVGRSNDDLTGNKNEFYECGAYGNFVRGDVAAGGFAGVIHNRGLIIQSLSIMDVKSPRSRTSSVSGGFVGMNTHSDNAGKSDIKYSYSSGSIDEKNTKYTGAFIGSSDGNSIITLNRCFYRNYSCQNTSEKSTCMSGIGDMTYALDNTSSYGAFDLDLGHARTVSGGVKIEAGKMLMGQLNEAGSVFKEYKCYLPNRGESLVIPVPTSIVPEFCVLPTAE